jgi:hypothetical protein
MFEPPAKVQSLMQTFERDWCIAGGWAIDLFLGQQTRVHDDIEIAIFREDQFALQNYLSDWNLQKADHGQLLEWKSGEYLELPVHGIHCFNQTAEISFLEVLLNERRDEVWQFRRNRNITKPLSDLYLTDHQGIKFLRPEVVLLYKSKNPRQKDEQDFEKTLNHLSPESKEWLKNALSLCDTENHWLPSL